MQRRDLREDGSFKRNCTGKYVHEGCGRSSVQDDDRELYFRYVGNGAIDLMEIELME